MSTEPTKQRPTYEQLEDMLADVLDAHYGTAFHHIGDGDGLDKGEAEQLREWWMNYCNRDNEAIT